MFTLPSEENVARCVVTGDMVKGEAEIALEYRTSTALVLEQPEAQVIPSV